jgi:hypothetical protein
MAGEPVLKMRVAYRSPGKGGRFEPVRSVSIMSGEAKRIVFRASAGMAEAIREIAGDAGHGSASEVIRTAVAVAYFSWCEVGRKRFLRNGDGRQAAVSFPSEGPPEERLDHVVQLRCDERLSSYLRQLRADGFGATPTSVIRRSVGLYAYLLRCRDDRWGCGYFDDHGDFTLLPVASLILPHRRRQGSNRPSAASGQRST